MRIPELRLLRFRLALIPLLAAIAVIALTVVLGNWQTRRAEQKTVLREQMNLAARAVPVVPDADQLANAPAGLEYRHLGLTGVWLPDAVVYLDNRPQDGRAGFYVLMAFRTDSNKVVIVNRGWSPRDPEVRTRIAPYGTPTGTLTIAGIGLADEQRLMQLGHAEPGKLKGIWQNFDFAEFVHASGLAPVQLILRQDHANTPADGLTRNWPEAGSDLDTQIARHRGYAFQWYALAALVLALVLFFGFRNPAIPKGRAPAVDLNP